MKIQNNVREDIIRYAIKEFDFGLVFGELHYQVKGLSFPFWKLPFEMQVGVLMAYCESKEFYISIECELDEHSFILTNECIYDFHWYLFNKNGTSEGNKPLESRKQAQISALEQAFKLISKTL